jgi:hypothetical protein
MGRKKIIFYPGLRVYGQIQDTVAVFLPTKRVKADSAGMAKHNGKLLTNIMEFTSYNNIHAGVTDEVSSSPITEADSLL